MTRRQFGGWTVTALHDGRLDLPASVVLGLDEAEVLALRRQDGRADGFSSVNAYLLQRDGRSILVDAGSFDGMAPEVARLPASLAAAGVAPEAVTLVLLTHAHGDHAGGLLTPGGAPRFPNAEVALAEEEAEHWLSETAREQAPEARRAGFDRARTWLAPYRLRRLAPGGIEPGLTRVALPGHTPGHSGYRVGEGAEALLIWGDIMHMPAVQAPRPDASVTYDTDPALAAQTRRHLLDQVAAERTLVAGMHLDFPGFARVEHAGSGFRVVPA